MLNAIRKNAGSWVVKVLMLLLVASFAIWGIGDIFYGAGQNPTVATVGDTEIPANELADAFDRAVNNLQRQFGPQFDREQAVQLGVMQQALQGLVDQRLIALRANEMGLRVPDDTLRAMVTQNPAFQTGGQFDRNRFDQLLRLNGLSEEGYLAVLRQEVMRDALAGSIAGPVAVPPGLVEALYRFRNEQRRGHYVAVPVDSIIEVPDPTEEELAAFHEAHEAEFTTPQYRALTFVTLAPADLIDEVEIGEEAIEAAYQERLETYRTPERRTVAQLLATEEGPIKQAAKRLAEGATFEAVAAEIEGLSVEQLGTVVKGDLPPEFEEAIFAQAEGEISDPVNSAFGWHIFRVSEIAPEQVVPLAEAREELAKELALEEASARLPDFAAQLDDELAAGTPLAEAARAVGLEAASVPAVDARGTNPEGEPIEALPAWPEFMRVALETPAGETSLLEETDAGGYFVVQVDKVMEPRLKPVEEVRDELRQGWQDERRGELARARAEELRAKLDGGAEAGAVLAEAGLEAKALEPLRRDQTGEAQGVNRAVVRALFATEPGEIASEVVEVAGGFAVVGTDEVIAADPSANPEALNALSEELQGEMRSDLIAQFETQLRQDYPVEIDGAAINRLIGEDGLVPGGSAGALPGGPLYVPSEPPWDPMASQPDLAGFTAIYQAGRPQVVWTSLVADLETPVSAMLKLAEGRPYSFLLESVEGGAVRGRYSAIGLKPDLIWRCFGDRAEVNRRARHDLAAFEPCPGPALNALGALIEESQIALPDGLPPMAAGLFGFMGYDMVRLMERLPDANPDALGIPDAVLMRPTVMAIFDNIEDRVVIVTPVWPMPDLGPRAAHDLALERIFDVVADFDRGVAHRGDWRGPGTLPEATSNITRARYHEMVETAKEYIRAGDVFQVVPSQRFSLPFDLPPFALYRALRRLNPSPFLFFLDFDGFALVGSSPEILVRLRDGSVVVRPIAGTRRRGATRAEDSELAQDMLSDPKELAEHLMLLDLGRNDVGRVAEIGSIRVTEKMAVEFYSHVMHIVSNVEGRIRPDRGALDALIAGFPAGTVSGAPKVRAMEIIDEMEPERRSFYAGAVGYFSADGNMDTCIALRTALVKDGRMYVQAGGGVVADSDPEAEYQESCNKARALIRAAEEAVAFARSAQ